MPSGRDVLDAIFMIGQTAGFEIPGIGTAIGATCAIAQPLFDLFYPEDAHADYVTPLDLDNALAALKAEDFDNFKQVESSNAGAMYSNLRAAQKIAKLPANHGAGYDGQFDKSFGLQDWKDGLATFATPVNGSDTRIAQIEEWVDGCSAKQLPKTIGLYIMAADLRIQYTRLAVLWELNIKLRINQDAMDAYKAAWTDYQKQVAIWNAKGATGPKPTFQGTPIDKILDTNSLCHKSDYAARLVTALSSNVKWLESKLDPWEKKAKDFGADLKARNKKFRTYTAPYMVDPKVGKVWGNYDKKKANGPQLYAVSKEAADISLRIMKGINRAEWWLGAQDDSDGWSRIEPDYLVLMRKTLDKWKKLQSDLQDPKQDIVDPDNS